MKNFLTLIMILFMITFLSACSSAATGEGSSQENALTDSSSETAVEQELALPDDQNSPEAREDLEIPLQLELLLGTYLLKGTDQQITPEKAAEILPLWKAVRSLGNSDTTAAEELQAVYNQIQDTLTSEQLEAIAALELSNTDLPNVMREMGIDMGNMGDRFADLSPEMQATAQAARESGERPAGGNFPGGGMPGQGPGGGGGVPPDGGVPGGGGFIRPEDGESGNEFRRVNSGIPALLLDAYIKFLETKTND